MPGEDALSVFMRRYQQGDGDALAELYRTTAGRLIPYLFSMVRDRALAEDLLQETFLRVHKVRHTYTYGRPVLPWLYAIARHVAQDAARSRRRRAEVGDGETLLRQLPALESRRDEGHPDLWRALEQLPASWKEPLLLTKASGLSVREAASVLGISEGAVKVRVHRAVRAVRRALGQSTRERWESME